VTAALRKIFGTAGDGRPQVESEPSKRKVFLSYMRLFKLPRIVRVYTAKEKQRLACAPEPRTSQDSIDPEDSESESDEEENADTTPADKRAQSGPSQNAAVAHTYPPESVDSPEETYVTCFCIPLKKKKANAPRH